MNQTVSGFAAVQSLLVITSYEGAWIVIVTSPPVPLGTSVGFWRRPVKVNLKLPSRGRGAVELAVGVKSGELALHGPVTGSSPSGEPSLAIIVRLAVVNGLGKLSAAFCSTP